MKIMKIDGGNMKKILMKEILDFEKEIGVDLIVEEFRDSKIKFKAYFNGGFLCGVGYSLDEALEKYACLLSESTLTIKGKENNLDFVRVIKCPQLKHSAYESSSRFYEYLSSQAGYQNLGQRKKYIDGNLK